jgi:hypothetical protein
VLHDSHQRKLIINRCWLIYDFITKKFRPLNEFHIEFPSRAELALISGYLQVLVEITRRGHFLGIHEEYDFIEHMLVVKVYSYNFLDKSKHSIIRADSLPLKANCCFITFIPARLASPSGNRLRRSLWRTGESVAGR